MISFDLLCRNGHKFEGWFGNSADYDNQLASGLLACPICDSTKVSKALSAPNISAKGNQKKRVAAPSETEHAPAVNVEELQEPTSVSNIPELPDEMVQAVEKLADMQKNMLKDSEWVGRKFADEARAIHYGETDSRIIHGETSPEEAQELADEGVSVAPLLFPHVPPEAKN